MIEKLEIAKSDRSKCKWCGKKIGIGTPRGVESSYYNNHTEYVYCCYKCLVSIKFDLDEANLKMLFDKTKELKEELNKMIKDNQKAIILDELQEKK